MPETDDTCPRRTITDADARQIAREMVGELFGNLTEYVGKGVLSLAWHGLWVAIIAAALWGAAHIYAPTNATPPQH